MKGGFAENEHQLGYGAKWGSREETATKVVDAPSGKISYISATAAKEAASKAKLEGGTMKEIVGVAIAAAKSVAQIWKNRKTGMYGSVITSEMEEKLRAYF